mmetsp:Transcript_17215/g.33786  ORF Transcript_17215/g.33786 Transcript_17215/m.33786 type:complete len:242 (-) Transcript_17215:645-1370(-)
MLGHALGRVDAQSIIHLIEDDRILKLPCKELVGHGRPRLPLLEPNRLRTTAATIHLLPVLAPIPVLGPIDESKIIVSEGITPLGVLLKRLEVLLLKVDPVLRVVKKVEHHRALPILALLPTQSHARIHPLNKVPVKHIPRRSTPNVQALREGHKVVHPVAVACTLDVGPHHPRVLISIRHIAAKPMPKVLTPVLSKFRPEFGKRLERVVSGGKIDPVVPLAHLEERLSHGYLGVHHTDTPP